LGGGDCIAVEAKLHTGACSNSDVRARIRELALRVGILET
jgi:hypothetical protein